MGPLAKAKIQALINQECSFQPSQRTSIYAYFFYHASVFLKDRGYLAFICQNSWLDTDYGIDLQRYLLRNYEIVAIMDSEVERFFPSASVNTTIVIARKQRDEDARNANTVKFIYFTSTLKDAIKNYKGVDKLQNILESTTTDESNNFFHLNCICQETLSKFTKWGQFLKAPQVYFDIVKRGAEKFVPLSQIADIKFGIKTGCNDFFIVKQIKEVKVEMLQAAMNNINELKTIKQVDDEGLCLVINGFNELWLIEKKFLFPMLTSPKDLKIYHASPDKLLFSVFINNEEKKNLKISYPHSFSYIINAERKHINKASSLAARNKWYFVGAKKVPPMSFNYIINDSGKTFLVNAYSNNNFHNIYSEKRSRTIWLFMNSTLSWLTQQLIMRANLGDGAGKIETYDLAALPIPNIDLEGLKVDLIETKNFKEELGTLESLKTVNPERIKLDSAILEAIGYNNKKERDGVLLELYKSTYNLINSRLQKAQSLKGVKAQRNKVEFSVYVEQLKAIMIEEKLPAKNTFKFAQQLQKLVREISSENNLQKKILDAYWREKFGETFNEKEIANQEQGKLF